MSIFEQATRSKLRFASNKGELTTEQLWDLPLTARNGFDLDNVAKEAHREVVRLSEESFVATKANPAKKTAELKLEVVKHVIATMVKEQEEARSRSAKAAERARLLEIKHNLENKAYEGMTLEQIDAKLKELEA